MNDIITSVKETEDNESYLVNGNMSVPKAPGNRHYQAVMEWIAAGNIPEPYAPPVKPSPSEGLLETAQLFKTILQIHFGEGAETNTNITERAVTQYFVNRRLTGTSDTTDASDGILLQKGFDAIKEYTGDGTVWSFPWELLD